MRKIGVFLPTRQYLRKTSYEKPGIFLEVVGKAILEELRKYYDVVEDLDFRKASVISGKVFFEDFDSSRLDGYFWFSVINKDSDAHDILILEQLERNMPVINPSFGLKIGLDKFKTSSFLKAKGIPVPDFAFVNSSDEHAIAKIFRQWQGSVLAKPRFGGFGVGIFKADNSDQLIDLLDYSKINDCYVERFYENDMNDWIGVNMVGGKVLYCYGKESAKIKGYKVFDRLEAGGSMILKEPDDEQVKIALDVAEATSMDFFGIDIIKSREGKYLVIDMNTFPGIYPDMLNPEVIAKSFIAMVKKKINTE